MDKNLTSIKRSLSPKSQNYAMLLLGLLLFGVSIWLMAIYFNYYQARFYPKTFIDDVAVSGMTRSEALAKVRENMQNPVDFSSATLRLFYGDQAVETPLSKLDVRDNLDLLVDQAFNEREAQHWSTQLRQIVKQNFSPKRYHIGLTYNEQAIKDSIISLKEKTDQIGEKPSALISGQTVTMQKGKTSSELSVEETWSAIHQQILSRRFRELRPNDLNLEAQVEMPIVALDDTQIETSQQRAQKFLGKTLTFAYDYQKIVLNQQDLLSILKWPEGIDSENLADHIETMRAQVDRPSQNAVFNYDPETLQVHEFLPDQAGLTLDQVATEQIIHDFIRRVETAENDSSENPENNAPTFDLPLQSAPAAVTLEQANTLGIKEVIGFGESWYDHSIPNRIYNVDITTARITNHIVKPGAEYSFNKALGEVSERTGFRNAYIIEGGQTKLAPGGGVCQVSSTLFRSLLNAGVKISKRLPHAYRVSYYEIGNEPGFDATVYSGEVDLRFINDTPAHILISCQSDAESLYMSCKLYGTSDGRSTEIVNYKKWDQRSALPTVYIDDPSLAPGQLKQIDWSASGIKTEFTNVIRDRDGAVIREDVYKSSYRSWAAKYLRGV